MKEVKGGYYFERNNRYDHTTGVRSVAYEVKDVDNNKLQLDSSSVVVAKYRYVNNTKEYYLQSYDKNLGRLNDIATWNGSYAFQVLKDFERRY